MTTGPSVRYSQGLLYIHTWYTFSLLDTAVEKAKSSLYFKRGRPETTCWTVIDIIMCDRLECLDDKESTLCLNWLK